uniref:DUF488 domain-containing protein n=1 Tax=Candidatus Scatocola faecipullorum TaxID=2840917 RepID=UPI004029AE59
MFYRQKLILSLLQAFDGSLDKTDFQKYLFLYTKICQPKEKRDYNFVPYKYGCFSFQSYADIRNLEQSQYLIYDEHIELKNKDADFISLLDNSDKNKILKFKEMYSRYKGEDLIRYVYEKYPYYTLNSKIFDRICPSQDRFELNVTNDEELFTIGYEANSIDDYVNKLIQNNIKLVCDVRKNPVSRKYGFSKSSMKNIIEKMGLDYINIPELGIESEQRTELNTMADYNKLFSQYEKTTLLQSEVYLDKILDLIKQYKRVALTCFEADYHMCHRTRVANALVQKRPDLKLEHI